MKNAEALIKYLAEYIEYSLKEISVNKDASPEFLSGEAYAYMECLEIILLHAGASSEDLLKKERLYGAG